MPKHKSDAERGYYGVWLRAGRERLGWTQKEVVAWLHDHGVTLDDNYYRQVESGPGRRLGPEAHGLLVGLYGTEPTQVEPEQRSKDDLAAAILRLAEAVEAQTRMMAAREESHESWMRELAAGLVGLRAVAPDGASTAPPVVAEPQAQDR